MLKNILNLGGAQQLSKKEQNTINGGAGPYSVKCSSGVWISGLPDLNTSNTSYACSNQGGYTGTWMCVGPECPGEQ